MRKKILLLLFLSAGLVSAQPKNNPAPASGDVPRPKLVVGIIVDQMRYDYFYRYYEKYGKGGIKRFLRDGFTARNNHYHYALTVTAPGHASVYTGSAPAIHGIVGNDWYDPITKRAVYCVEDSTVTVVGSNSEGAGKMSPRNLLVSTIPDQLKVATNFRSRTIGISIKNRGAILPAGHTADAAYWFDSKTGNFITSTFYMKELPGWVKEYNDKKYPSQYAQKGWETLLPIEQYEESTADDQAWERKNTGEEKPVFPHALAGISGNVFGTVSSTPWGNTMVKDMGLAAIKNEKLGKNKFTDFLALSFSATDAVGHQYGPNSIEAEDVYLRLDRDFEEIFNFLDGWVGKENYTVFLSADHGVMEVPAFWNSKKLPAGTMSESSIVKTVKSAMKEAFGEGDFLRAAENYQIYLNHEEMDKRGISQDAVAKVIKKALISDPAIADILNLKNLNNEQLTDYQLGLYKNLVNVKRSGDLQIVPRPGWFPGSGMGTTHGSPYNYDTHVPFAMFGWGVKKGETLRRTYVADIAPTIAALLHTLPPNGSIGNPVVEALK
ncbi:alkaline phosphatase family protein [Ravibacter arvi]|uniref:Alkaline phosphatase family protein n=1 Tax=Ravibacter arvi TaxID=2051041 RepID=A0ABP8LW32_9BACT